MSDSRVVLVAGATGSLGRCAIDAMSNAGFRVRAMARASPRLEALRSSVHEVTSADALKPETLRDSCNNVNVVLSTIGASVLPSIRSGRTSYASVDLPANVNLIDAARRAGVEKFIYVSLYCDGSSELRNSKYVRSHERVVDRLSQSGMKYTIIRPTGFFSSFGEFVAMARRGQPAPVFARGSAKTNPVHECDVAELCVQAAIDMNGDRELPIGGPDVFTRRRIAEMAFEAFGRKPRILSAPAIAGSLASVAMQPFNPRIADLLAFIVAISKQDLIAPQIGHRRLVDYFEAMTRRA